MNKHKIHDVLKIHNRAENSGRAGYVIDFQKSSFNGAFYYRIVVTVTGVSGRDEKWKFFRRLPKVTSVWVQENELEPLNESMMKNYKKVIGGGDSSTGIS